MIRLRLTDRFQAKLTLNGTARELIRFGLFREASSIGLCEYPVDGLYSQLRVFLYSEGCRTEYSVLTWRLNQYIHAELIVGDHGAVYVTATSGHKCYSLCFTDRSLKKHWMFTHHAKDVVVI